MMATCKLMVVLLAVFITQSFGNILRLPCKNVADFSVVRQDSGLNSNAVIKTLENTNQEGCRAQCIGNSDCKSFSTKDNTCELNSKSTEDSNDGVSLESRPGWTYYSTNYDDTLNGPTCQEKNPCPGKRCFDTCTDPGYHCHDMYYLQVPIVQACCPTEVTTTKAPPPDTTTPQTTTEPLTSTSTTTTLTTTTSPPPFKPYWKEIGCFKDFDRPNRALPILFANFRTVVDWKDLPRQASLCKNAALEKQYKWVGVQFYGECWWGQDAANTYNKHGPSTDCVSGTGKHFANMVYKYIEKEESLVNP